MAEAAFAGSSSIQSKGFIFEKPSLVRHSVAAFLLCLLCVSEFYQVLSVHKSLQFANFPCILFLLLFNGIDRVRFVRHGIGDSSPFVFVFVHLLWDSRRCGYHSATSIRDSILCFSSSSFRSWEMIVCLLCYVEG